MKEQKEVFMGHFVKEKKEVTITDDEHIEIGFQKLINTAIAQINNNT